MAAPGAGLHPRSTLADRRLFPGTKRVLFALVANRALAAFSKLAVADWVCSKPGNTADSDLIRQVKADLREERYCWMSPPSTRRRRG